MTPPKSGDQLRMSEPESDVLLMRAAETGAHRALQEMSLIVRTQGRHP